MRHLASEDTTVLWLRLRSGKAEAYLYTEVYDVEIEGGHWMHGGTRYFAPDGHKIGEKHVDFSADPYIPVYRLELPEVQYDEGISKVSDDHIEIYKDSPRARPQERQHSSGKSHWPPRPRVSQPDLSPIIDELVAGKTLSFRLVVAGKLDAIQFRARARLDERRVRRQAGDPPQHRARLRCFDSAIDPLILTYDPQTKRLLDYRGARQRHQSGHPQGLQCAHCLLPTSRRTMRPKTCRRWTERVCAVVAGIAAGAVDRRCGGQVESSARRLRCNRRRQGTLPILLDFHAPWSYSSDYMASKVLTGKEWTRYGHHRGASSRSTSTPRKAPIGRIA